MIRGRSRSMIIDEIWWRVFSSKSFVMNDYQSVGAPDNAFRTRPRLSGESPSISQKSTRNISLEKRKSSTPDKRAGSLALSCKEGGVIPVWAINCFSAASRPTTYASARRAIVSALSEVMAGLLKITFDPCRCESAHVYCKGCTLCCSRVPVIAVQSSFPLNRWLFIRSCGAIVREVVVTW